MAEDATMAEPADDKATDGQILIEGTSSGLEYFLHPLVLINMSDHVMRTKVAANNASNAHPRVIGCLLGQTTGRTVDISNSFELLETTTSDGAPAFDQELFTMRLEQYQEVFKSLEVIGWYATGSGLQPSDLTLHKRFAETMDAPILLSLDADATMVVGAKELPVALYESGVHLIDGRPETRFVKVEFSIASSDAERIGVNSAAEVASGQAGENSALARHYAGLHGSLAMLKERLELLVQALQRMQDGAAPVNHQVVRMVSGLLCRFQGLTSQELSAELVNESTETALVNMLSLMTRGVSECQQLVEVSGIAYGKK